MRYFSFFSFLVLSIILLISCGTESSNSNFFECPEFVADIDGNSYKLVEIGEQCWMAKNLRTSEYRDGSSIPNVTDSEEWKNLTTGAWIHYDNDDNYEDIYGKLYNWFAVNDDRALCPEDFKIPSDDDWKDLEIHLDMDENYLDFESFERGESENVGGKLKSTGTNFWNEPNSGAIDEYGFSAFPAGFHFGFNGLSIDRNKFGYFWTSSENDFRTAWWRYLGYNQTGISRGTPGKTSGLSVRCILIN